MPFILNIDTALETAHISIAEDGILLQELINTETKDHSSFLQPSIKRLLASIDIDLQQIDAVAVTEGPGSYTGLRVGMAAAKGLCYALNKPLITINTLEALSATALSEFNVDTSTLVCPMIDARRMEVYTAIYDATLIPLLKPCALILNEKSFADYFKKNKIVFVGSGAPKWGDICSDKQAIKFQKMDIASKILSNLSFKKYLSKEFSDIAYTEPLYLKEFFDIGHVVK